MEVTYRRDGEHNYMIWKGPEDMQGSEYQVRMILVNEIPGLLRCRLRNVDGVSYLYYEITSKQPLARIFEYRVAEGDDIRALVQAIGRTMEGIARYLLPDDGLLLDPELIYMDVETREVSFCYLPFCEERITGAFRGLAEYLLKNLNHEDEQAVFWGYRLYSGTVEENYSVYTVIQEMHGKLEKSREKRTERKSVIKADAEKKIPVRQMMTGQEHLKKKEKRKRTAALVFAALSCIAGCAVLAAFHILTLTQAGGILFLAGGIFYYLCAGRKEKKENPGKEKKKRRRMEKVQQDSEKRNEEEKREEQKAGEQKWELRKAYIETEMGEPEEEICDFREDSGEKVYGQTTLLGDRITGEHPVLISRNPDIRENAIIDKEKFVIGKLKGQVDLALNLPVISRIHAGIERREEGYFLVDLNSTNGTYLNGERLEANEYRQIRTGDEIIFAGTGYYFKE